ncbi:hypothetical protein GGP41_001490 [Bipolaris sorokiniana]|uniref:Uncharacterized protein n=1 Tax=Cochliobolus sativus TaxID=45130 RepID=A0A8H5ZSD6_COCSA|nr:hypothetical protein GGP41_001490 [Bipolaris sorokiniana]
MRRGDRWQKLLLIARGPWRTCNIGQRAWWYGTLESRPSSSTRTYTHTHTEDAFPTQRPPPRGQSIPGARGWETGPSPCFGRAGAATAGLVCVTVLYAATATAWSPAIHPPRPSGSTLTRLTASSTVYQAGNVTQSSVAVVSIATITTLHYTTLHYTTPIQSPLPVLKHCRPPFETRLATRLDWPSLPVAYRALPCWQTIGLHLKHCAFLPSCPQHHSQSCNPPEPAIQPLAAAPASRATHSIGCHRQPPNHNAHRPVGLPLSLASHLHHHPRGLLLLSITLAGARKHSFTHTVSHQLPFFPPFFSFPTSDPAIPAVQVPRPLRQ